jgi:hydrogenase-4 component B
VTGALLSALWLLPLLLAPAAAGRAGPWLPALAPLPALAAALWLPAGSAVAVPWVLLGVELGLDATGRTFLLFSAVLWLAAAVYARDMLRHDPLAGRFRVFYLLAMAGNLGLIVAQDMASFFTGYAVMGLAAYGLVVQRRSDAVRRAGRVYLVWTVAGEVALFSAVVLLAAQVGGPGFAALQGITPSQAAVALLVLAFGIKLALPGLHVWLPLAYPAAPPAGAAVLSGVLINAGLLGWLRFLPPGDDALAPWGHALAAVGLTGALYGVVVGLLQRGPKTVLAYSSVSKMGILTAGMGVVLAVPEAAPALITALSVYAAHHALVKAALFLGVGLPVHGRSRRWVMAGLAFLALALAGAPLTSGALAKAALKGALPDEAAWLAGLLGAATVATTLLMARFMHLAARTRGVRPRAAQRPRLAWLSWLALLAAIAAFPLVVGEPRLALGGAVPVLLGALLAGAVLVRRLRALGALVGRIPPGDVLALAGPVRHALGHLSRTSERIVRASQKALRRASDVARASRPPPRDPEALLVRWPVAGTLWLALAGLLLLAVLALPQP